MTDAAEPFCLEDAYYGIGRVVVIAATLERTIISWWVELCGGDDRVVRKAAEAPACPGTSRSASRRSKSSRSLRRPKRRQFGDWSGLS